MENKQTQQEKQDILKKADELDVVVDYPYLFTDGVDTYNVSPLNVCFVSLLPNEERQIVIRFNNSQVALRLFSSEANMKSYLHLINRLNQL